MVRENGKWVDAMDVRKKNGIELKQAWKRFLRWQSEKEKAEKENKKTAKKDWLVSQKIDGWNPVSQHEGVATMKTYIVTVDKKMIDNKVYCTQHFRIMANSTEEARSIVHNSMELHFEPNFEITKVEEWK